MVCDDGGAIALCSKSLLCLRSCPEKPLVPPKLHDGFVHGGRLGCRGDHLNSVKVVDELVAGPDLIGACRIDPHCPTCKGRSGRAVLTQSVNSLSSWLYTLNVLSSRSRLCWPGGCVGGSSEVNLSGGRCNHRSARSGESRGGEGVTGKPYHLPGLFHQVHRLWKCQCECSWRWYRSRNWFDCSGHIVTQGLSRGIQGTGHIVILFLLFRSHCSRQLWRSRFVAYSGCWLGDSRHWFCPRVILSIILLLMRRWCRWCLGRWSPWLVLGGLSCPEDQIKLFLMF